MVTTSGLVPITFYLPADMVKKIDEATASAQKTRPLALISRGSVVRELLDLGLKARKK